VSNYVLSRLPAPPVRVQPALNGISADQGKQLLTVALALGVGMLIYRMFLEPETKQESYNRGYAKGYDSGMKDARLEELHYGETLPGLPGDEFAY